MAHTGKFDQASLGAALGHLLRGGRRQQVRVGTAQQQGVRRDGVVQAARAWLRPARPLRPLPRAQGTAIAGS